MFSTKLPILSISCLIIVIGLLVNGFIVIMNLFWWIKRQTLQTINVLLTSLGLVRLVLLCIHAQNVSLMMSGGSLFNSDWAEILGTFAICLIFCSLWWGSVLCVFYCVKITNYSNRIFIRIKMNISKMAPWMLLISLIISKFSSLPYSLSLISSLPVDINDTNHTNDGNIHVNAVNLFKIFFAGSVVPFMICCVAIYLIIVSLVRHTRNMNGRDSGFNDFQRDVHIRVIWNMVSFLVFYALYVISYILTIISLWKRISALLFFIPICAYPSLHSFSFIFSNQELKKSFSNIVTFISLGHITLQVP